MYHKSLNTWQPIYKMIVAELNDELADQDRQQAIFSLLGEGFVLKNFPHHKYVYIREIKEMGWNFLIFLGNIGNGLPIIKVKRGKNFRAKLA